MSDILTTSDFSTGRFKIPKNQWQTNDLQEYIDSVEDKYLPRLFGKDLSALFIADLSGGVPVTPRFVTVFNPFTDQTDIFVESEGIKEMLKGFVYYHYVRDNISRLYTDGAKVTTGENSTNVTAIGHDITSRYNEAIATFKTIQYYMEDVNSTDYPEYDGVLLRFNHMF